MIAEEAFWTYIDEFLPDPDVWFKRCKEEIKLEQWTYEKQYGDVTVSGNRPRQSKFYKFDGSQDLPEVVKDLIFIMNSLVNDKDFITRFKIDPGIKFDSVLVNYYKDGRSHIQYHSDSESKLSNIFGLSLGAERILNFRLIKDNKKVWTYKLKSGSLYVMGLGCQIVAQHRIMKTTAKNQPGPRFSFTFRHDETERDYTK